MCKPRNGDWFSTLRNETSNRIIYTIIILEKLAEIYGICKWLIAHCKKKNIRDLWVFYQNWTYYGRIVFVVVGCLFYYIYLYDSRLYGIIRNIYAMLSNELHAFIFICIELFFACLLRLIVDMILNLNGKFSARVQILWQKQTVSTRILNDLIV